MKTGVIRVEGTDKAIKALAAKMSSLGGLSRQGLIKAGLMIQRRAQENITEDHLIDTGNLRASAYTVWAAGPAPSPTFNDDGKKTGLKSEAYMSLLSSVHTSAVEAARSSAAAYKQGKSSLQVVVGFGAFYALFVHEDGVTRNWVGAKFLERAILDAKDDINGAMAGEMQRSN